MESRAVVQPRVGLVGGNDGGFWRLIEQRSRKPENPS
jgi:hypothetical protein